MAIRRAFTTVKVSKNWEDVAIFVRYLKSVMKWITCERPKIDRIACPWLIKNFVDQDAIFNYVPKEEVIRKAGELDAIPFDLPGVEYTHVVLGKLAGGANVFRNWQI